MQVTCQSKMSCVRGLESMTPKNSSFTGQPQKVRTPLCWAKLSAGKETNSKNYRDCRDFFKGEHRGHRLTSSH